MLVKSHNRWMLSVISSYRKLSNNEIYFIKEKPNHTLKPLRGLVEYDFFIPR